MCDICRYFSGLVQSHSMPSFSPLLMNRNENRSEQENFRFIDHILNFSGLEIKQNDDGRSRMMTTDLFWQVIIVPL